MGIPRGGRALKARQGYCSIPAASGAAAVKRRPVGFILEVLFLISVDELR
jgi:hypothetical protein